MNYDDYSWGDCTFPYMYCKPLYNYLKNKTFKHGLEIGFDSGSSALVFLAAQPKATLTSVDIRPLSELKKGNDLLVSHKMVDRHEYICGDSHEVMADMIEQGMKFDYIYVDGDHLYDGVFQDLKDAVKLLAKGGVIVVDDCVKGHALFGVYKAVENLKTMYGKTLHCEDLEGHINRAVILSLWE